MEKFYLHCAIPYVNAKPHIGHALELIQTDAIGRYHRLIGKDVLQLTGADENALKNVQAAEAAGEEVQSFVDRNAELFKNLIAKLNAQFDVFQKGSDKENHYVSSQKLWKLCDASGDIYKKTYKGLYCVGCETFYSPDELNDKGECYEHPGKKLEEVEEENYFFKLSKYQDKILDLIDSGTYTIIPEKRKNEVVSFLKSGLQDISISRTNKRAKNWGVPVPGDPKQRMYVWFDALNIYQSGIGFGWDDNLYKRWWPADLQVIGKGIIRFHAIYWLAFLLSAKLPLPKALLVHDYFTVNGQKMSKTVGNVYDPVPLLEKYGADPVRYYCLAKISPFEDGDFSEEKFIEIYTADLANNLGNLLSRVSKLADNGSTFDIHVPLFADKKYHEYHEAFSAFRFDHALALIWKKVDEANKFIDGEKPWTQTGADLHVTLTHLIGEIREIALLLTPLLPETSAKIEKQLAGPEIKACEPLFPRIS